MNIKLEILQVERGILSSQIWRDFEFNEFIWSVGNFSCDCNREDFFYDALDITIDPFLTLCSEGRYKVRISNYDTGQVLYNELEEDLP